jgi:hypothetical protein
LGSEPQAVPPEPSPEPPLVSEAVEPALPIPCQRDALGRRALAACGAGGLPGPDGSVDHSSCSQDHAGLVRVAAANRAMLGAGSQRAGIAVSQTASIMVTASRAAQRVLEMEDGAMTNLLIRAGRRCGRRWPRGARAVFDAPLAN